MKIVVRAEWDSEAQVWVAEAAGDLGLVTEAGTIEELQRKLTEMVPDLLEGVVGGPFELDLVSTGR